MTVKEAACKWGMSAPNVFFYLDRGRVPGARRQQQSTWFIPDNAPRPETKKRGRHKLSDIIQHGKGGRGMGVGSER